MTSRAQRRVAAIEACRERVEGKPYKPGTRDCVKLAGCVMHKMGRRVGLTKGVRYSTEAGALKALKKAGFDDLPSAVAAAGLERIAPAAALPGDLLGFESDDPFGCSIWVNMGNGKALGFKADHEVGVVIAIEAVPKYAWRV